MLFDNKNKFVEDRYYWTKWGLQQGMEKYREFYKYVVMSGHINWKEKLNETKE